MNPKNRVRSPAIFSRPETLICAHRGLHTSLHENTAQAFEAAVLAGADMLELDIRKTSDGRLVVFHDPEIKYQNSKLKISEITYRRLKEIAREEGFEPPLFEEIVAEFGGRIPLDVEIKEAGYEIEIMNVLLSRLSPFNFVITSFNEECILAVKTIFPALKAGLLLGDSSKSGAIARIGEGFPCLRLMRCRADFAAANWKLLRLCFIKRLRLAKFPVWVWTVNDPIKIKECILNGVETIITDAPELALKIREELKT